MTTFDADLGAELITELLDQGECVQFVARGRSMWPFIMMETLFASIRG